MSRASETENGAVLPSGPIAPRSHMSYTYTRSKARIYSYISRRLGWLPWQVQWREISLRHVDEAQQLCMRVNTHVMLAAAACG